MARQFIRRETNFLRRYTGLATCIDLLSSRHLTLRSTERWTDQNDRRMMLKYEQLAEKGPVVALCFTMSSEKHHHWTSYGLGSDAVCIEFNRTALEGVARSADANVHLRHDEIDYLWIKDIQAKLSGKTERLPFTKRRGFSDEREWRMIAHCKDDAMAIELEIDPSMVQQVTVSPSFPEDAFTSVKGQLRSISGWQKLSVRRSYLNDSANWSNAIETALGS